MHILRVKSATDLSKLQLAVEISAHHHPEFQIRGCGYRALSLMTKVTDEALESRLITRVHVASEPVSVPIGALTCVIFTCYAKAVPKAADATWAT